MQAGVIGTGAMGAGIAVRLKETGHQVHVRDVDPVRERQMAAVGATVHESPAAVVARAQAIFVVVVTAAQIDDVLAGADGLLAGLKNSAESADSTGARRQRKSIFFCSTIAPQDTIRFADQVLSHGGQAIDAPISGGPARAQDGTMSIMMAAPGAVLAAHSGVLNDIARHQFRISETIGDGARAKLVNNLAGGIHLAAAAEALALAEKLGLDPAQMQQLMTASSGQSWVADDRMPRALAGDYEPRAATRVLTKDLTLAAAVARQAGVPLPLGNEALAHFNAACDAGFAEEDDAALLKYFQALRLP